MFLDNMLLTAAATALSLTLGIVWYYGDEIMDELFVTFHRPPPK